MSDYKLFEWLENWYFSECNEEWEHQYGIKIDTLDNPGWTVSIDLEDTNLMTKPFLEIQYDNSKHDWYFCKISDGKFIGNGGPRNLHSIILIFKEWVES
ncbi:immunity 53 family protein [Leptospira weilii]|uniref:immunity 53 family protein n=1 Tax=Leptospira weilii TaxID=28184 RepID=UPI0005602A74|nr:immunity 53 family protein [Leptospira weilii]